MSFLPDKYKVPGARTLMTKDKRKGGNTRRRVDWNVYLFRCSSLDTLHVTKKDYSQDLLNLFVDETHNQQRVFTSPSMQLGIDQEQDSINLVNEIRGTQYQKNEKHFKNEFIKGTPDIISGDTVIDIKTCDVEGYPTSFENKTRAYALSKYKFQLAGYCWLTGKTKAEIIFTDNVNGKIKSVKFDAEELIPTLKKAVEDWRGKCWWFWGAGIVSPYEVPF